VWKSIIIKGVSEKMAEAPINRSKTAIIILDYQVGSLGFFPEEVQNGLISRANQVSAAARQKGIPIIFIRLQKGERTPDTEIHPQLVVQPGELVLTKKKSSPFSTTDLDARMEKSGIDTLVILGVYTGGCVLSTVKWAAEMDYKMFVLSDCCAERDEEVQRVLMEKVLTHKTTVLTVNGFLELLAKS
jgi:nicotinamidase-related amidase